MLKYLFIAQVFGPAVTWGCIQEACSNVADPALTVFQVTARGTVTVLVLASVLGKYCLPSHQPEAPETTRHSLAFWRTMLQLPFMQE